MCSQCVVILAENGLSRILFCFSCIYNVAKVVTKYAHVKVKDVAFIAEKLLNAGFPYTTIVLFDVSFIFNGGFEAENRMRKFK